MNITVGGEKKGVPEGETLAQLIADDCLGIHAAQRHRDGLRLGTAGIHIAPRAPGRGQEFSPLVRHAKDTVAFL